jgi:hypothetical protein
LDPEYQIHLQVLPVGGVKVSCVMVLFVVECRSIILEFTPVLPGTTETIEVQIVMIGA